LQAAKDFLLRLARFHSFSEEKRRSLTQLRIIVHPCFPVAPYDERKLIFFFFFFLSDSESVLRKCFLLRCPQLGNVIAPTLSVLIAGVWQLTDIDE